MLLAFLRDGRIGWQTYFLSGFGLMMVKQFVDRSIATHFHRQWAFWTYWNPLDHLARLSALPQQDRNYLAALALASLPFVLAGTVLTLARLRMLRLPLWLVTLFFIPIINLCFFLLLLSLSPREGSRRPAGNLGESRIASAMLAVLATTCLGLIVAVASVKGLQIYGVGLFIALPFCLGMLSALIHGFRHPKPPGECVGVGLIAAAVPCLLLLVFALEGLTCLVMALPLAFPLVVAGSLVGWAIQSRAAGEIPAQLFLVPVLFSPVLTVSESKLGHALPLRESHSAIVIQAPAQAVWDEVVAFSEIPEPTELLFKTGIAYPLRAKMEGHGPGAVRRCEFTTGAFIEPIEIWDEPRLLRFRVTHNPAPMNEWSPYGAIDTAHLHGTLVSRRGQFHLIPLPNGNTRLEGTTWYTQDLQPSEYWGRWSDYIIHRIHMRVLRHIRLQAERRSQRVVGSDRELRAADTARPAGASPLH